MYDSQNISVALSQIQNEQVANEENRTGFYRAIVVNNYDQMNLGRVRIRIPSFHGTNSAQSFYVSDDRLPYAYPASMNGAGNLSGQYIVPLAGSLVWASFETGTDNFVYFGGVYTTSPTGNRYIYFDRSTNSGEAKQITENDIPGDYDPNRYVIYRSPKGASIIIDDRDRMELVQISDSHGNKVTLGPNGVSIVSETPLSANFPYTTMCYVDADKADVVSTYELDPNDIYADEELTVKATPQTGSVISYVKDGVCWGSGIVSKVTLKKEVIVNNNGNYYKLRNISS